MVPLLNQLHCEIYFVVFELWYLFSNSCDKRFGILDFFQRSLLNVPKEALARNTVVLFFDLTTKDTRSTSGLYTYFDRVKLYWSEILSPVQSFTFLHLCPLVLLYSGPWPPTTCSRLSPLPSSFSLYFDSPTSFGFFSQFQSPWSGHCSWCLLERLLLQHQSGTAACSAFHSGDFSTPIHGSWSLAEGALQSQESHYLLSHARW